MTISTKKLEKPGSEELRGSGKSLEKAPNGEGLLENPDFPRIIPDFHKFTGAKKKEVNSLALATSPSSAVSIPPTSISTAIPVQLVTAKSVPHSHHKHHIRSKRPIRPRDRHAIEERVVHSVLRKRVTSSRSSGSANGISRTAVRSFVTGCAISILGRIVVGWLSE